MTKRQGSSEKKAAEKSKKGGQKITRAKTATRDEVRQESTHQHRTRQPGDRR